MCRILVREDNIDGLRGVLPGYLGDGAVDVSEAGEDCSEEDQASLLCAFTLRHEGEVLDVEVEVRPSVRVGRDPVFDLKMFRRVRGWEVLVARAIDVAETNDVLSGIEADNCMSVYGRHSDTLEAFEAFGPDPLAGE